MSGVGAVTNEFLHQTVRLVFSLPLFVLHYAALLIEAFLRNGSSEMPHSITLQPKQNIQGIFGSIFEIIRPVFAGRAIRLRRTYLIQRLEIIVVEILAPIKHEVLKQVRETGPAWPFVF